ncbi:MAG: hypothetical protein ACRD2L_08500 [Terriglobia bacterium]
MQERRMMTHKQHVGFWKFGQFSTILLVLLLYGVFPTPSALAQSSMGGWILQVSGVVEVEPGPDIVTFTVKKERIRFAVHNIHCSDQRVPVHRFRSDNQDREGGVLIRGDDEFLDLLLTEKPGKRALKLSGMYYPDSHMFNLQNLQPMPKQTLEP